MTLESWDLNKNHQVELDDDPLKISEQIKIELETTMSPNKPVILEREDGTVLINIPKSWYKIK